MTIELQEVYFAYTGNGVTAAFAYGCRIFGAADLVVKVAGIIQALDVHYTISGVDTTNGGTVTFLGGSIPANGALVELERVLAYSRVTGYSQNGDFRPETVDRDQDYQTALLQQAGTIAARADAGVAELQELISLYAFNTTGQFIKTSVSASTFGPDISAAIAVIGANRVTLVVDSPITVNADAVTHAQTSVVVTAPGFLTIADGKTLTINGSFTAGMCQAFAGAGNVGGLKKSRPEWFMDFVSGVTISDAAIQKAFNAAPRVDFMTANTYMISNPLNANEGQRIWLNGAIIKASGAFPSVTGTDVNMLNIKAVSNVRICNSGKFDMQIGSAAINGVNSGACVSIHNFDAAHTPDAVVRMSGFRLYDVECINCHSGIDVTNDVEDVIILRPKVTNYYVQAMAVDICYVGGVYKHFAKDVHIVDPKINSSNSTIGGIWISGASEVEVSGGHINDNQLGIQIYVNDLGDHVDGIDINGVRITITNTDPAAIEAGIKIFGASYNPAFYSTSATWIAKNIQIRNCTLTCGIDNTASKNNIRSAISANFIYDLSITGNKIYNWQRAIDLTDTYATIERSRTQAVVTGNYSNKSALAPISISKTASVLIQGNTFKNWNLAATTATEKAGIDLRKQKNVKLLDNFFVSDDGNDALRTHLVYATQASGCEISGNSAPAGVLVANVTSKDTLVEYHGPGYSNILGAIRVLEYGGANPYGTFKVGDKVRLFPAVLSSTVYYSEQVCTKEGTNKPATAATASGTTGTNVITLSATTDFHPGDFINIAGVTGYKRILDIDWSLSTATLSSNIDATVTGAAITWESLTMKYANPLAP